MKHLLLSEAIGDIAGSVYEFHSTKDYDSVEIFADGVDFTDDTVCTFACAEALMNDNDMAQKLQMRCRQHAHAGYGGRFRQWLHCNNPEPYGSYGNGSAMRCSAAGWMAKDVEECILLATRTAAPTHNHPEGIKGAVATALTIYHLRNGKDKDYIKDQVLNTYYPDWYDKSYDDIKPGYHFDVTCQGTVPAALITFIESKDYTDCIRKAIALGGDADTLGAIAGPMAYAFYKKINGSLVEQARKLLPEWMVAVSDEFDKRYGGDDAAQAGQDGEAENAASKKSSIYNLIIVDESGSMLSLRESTISGINETIGTIRQAQKENADVQEHFLTLVTFSSGSAEQFMHTIYDCTPIDKVGDFNDYRPNGCTPLYDTMGECISNLKNITRGNDKAACLVTILTDGLENSSHKWNSQDVRKLIDETKEMGWVYTYMGSAHDVKKVTDILSINNVVEFRHDSRGAANTWSVDSGAKMSFFASIANFDRCYADSEERMDFMRRMDREYSFGRVTPAHIDNLDDNEVFVFGSNAGGCHDGGAARTALNKFGAIYGQGEGLQGKSYAIPTMEGLSNTRAAVERFVEFASQHRELKFLVTAIGCGIAGYSAEEIAPMFEKAAKLSNVTLPKKFWDELGIDLHNI